MSSPEEIDWTRAVPLFMSEIEAMGGAERSILALGRWLHGHGRPSYLLTFVDHIGLEKSADFPLPTVDLKTPEGFRRKLGALRAHLRDVSPSAPAMMTSGYQPALYASLATKGRSHCLMHDTPSLFSPPEKRSMKQKLRLSASNWLIGRGMRRGGGRMIVTSEFLRDECFRDFGVKAEIARMGGLGNAAAPRYRPVEGVLRMLSVCRIEANKRIDWILDSLAELERATPPLSQRIDWRLDLAGGGGQLGLLQDRAAALGIGHRVHFHGFVPDEELEQMYEAAHLFLMPAVQGYGIPAIEALQRGIPVLLHRDSGVSDVLLDTPWAVVLHGGQESVRPALEKVIRTVLQGELREVAPPALPTEASWAEQVAGTCGYVRKNEAAQGL